jgi:serine protease AprX
VFVLLAAPLGHAVAAKTTPTAGSAPASFIVIARPGQFGVAARSVVAVGGRIGRTLGIINGFQAVLPPGAAGRVAAAAGVAGLSRDLEVRAQSTFYDSTTDPDSMYNVARVTGADDFWRAGYTGAGVGVAVIDSGITPVDGLADASRIFDGPDLSFESQADNLIQLDTFGHGTHMAGIIGGRSAAATPGSYATDTTNFLGMAPDATIVSLKVADAHGATDVSQVIAAIDWVVQHRADPGLNIRVLNLSYGTDSSQAYTLDPLAFAAEQAWNAGIFVVAATGNAGFINDKTSTITNPAYSPNIMAVGASDPVGTTISPNDRVASFSSSGNDKRKPDIVAPGTHVVSLRDPGSFLDQMYMSTGAVTDELFRGSGTSQAAAVASGAAALVIQQRPTITPRQLKQLLRQTALDLKNTPRQRQGEGELNLTKTLTTKTPGPASAATASTGIGSLEAARGSSHLVSDGVTLTGEQDIFGNSFDPTAMAQAERNGSSWSSNGDWNGSKWTGSDWHGSKWCGSRWSGSKWSGTDWSSAVWSGNTWDGSAWTAGEWSGSEWSGDTWATDVWASESWS